MKRLAKIAWWMLGVLVTLVIIALFVVLLVAVWYLTWSARH